MSRPLSVLLSISLLAASLSGLPPQAADSFPVTVENCGSSVTINAAPKRILLVNNDDIALLAEVDALDLLVARTSIPTANVYAPEVYAAIDKVPLISSETNATGGAMIALETILDLQPDLVLAPESAADRQLLAAAGIALYSPPAYCTDTTLIPGGKASFELVFKQLTTFGAILGKSDLAAERIAALGQEVETVGNNGAAAHGTGVALYVSAGGKTLSPYGARSMVTPIFTAVGLENVYGTTDERVFDASTEDLLGKNPDVIVLLYSGVTPDPVLADFASIPGVESFAAVQNGRVVPLAFHFTDPPSPMSIKGVGVLAESLSTLP